MDKSELLRFEAQAQIMKALSHPTRLFIVHQLAQTEKCVCELTTMVGADTSTVSKHLSIMKNAGIIDYEKRGTNIYYTLKMKCVLNFFTCVNEVLKNKVESQMVFP
ncbi:MAG TPA: metalloregulator ArsR/SmtB family transcription factor [Chitinispirillaceae bacterium]|nr:metalloregulator ArsR/SmtB family transcription factor [Chitinispirillaceae bacterium]